MNSASAKLILAVSCLVLLTYRVHSAELDSTPRVTLDFDAFSVIDAADGGRHTLRTLTGANGTVLFFDSNECPVALAYEQELARLIKSFESQGVALVAVNSNY